LRPANRLWVVLSMRILFVHQNFPGQFIHLAAALAQTGHEVVALSINQRAPIPGVKALYYKPTIGSTPQIHPLVADFETKVIRAEACVNAAFQIKQQGFSPDVIYAHTGWGESLFLKDIWPTAKLLCYFEFFYQAQGADCGFDPEFPEDALARACRTHTKNAHHLMSLEGADHGVSPTRWQWSTFPSRYQDKISVIHDGVDTDRIQPNPAVQISLTRDQLTLTAQDEVITFVNRNLEPLRGYHQFMRALPDILARRPQVHVLIVGGDEVSYGAPRSDGKSYRQQFWEEVKERLDQDRIHFLGKIPYPSFLQLLQLATVHVYLTYPFVLSWSMLEAMAAGALVVGSATPPVTEVIRTGENGLLVDFFSTSELVDAVCEGLQQRDRMLPLRQQARRTIEEHYDLQRICLPKQLELINNL
jgi:glycosyltransferase involved in cell wall biosynthesis